MFLLLLLIFVIVFCLFVCFCSFAVVRACVRANVCMFIYSFTKPFTWCGGYKTLFMLKSTEHDIFHAHKC